jgi:hypothetical protein
MYGKTPIEITNTKLREASKFSLTWLFCDLFIFAFCFYKLQKTLELDFFYDIK